MWISEKRSFIVIPAGCLTGIHTCTIPAKMRSKSNFALTYHFPSIKLSSIRSLYARYRFIKGKIEMSSAMRITGIRLKNYRQFRDFNLDLTDPKTKEPLDKVCFIGATGTGKSTLLALFAELLETGSKTENYKNEEETNQLIAYKVCQSKENFFILHDKTHNSGKWSKTPYSITTIC